jgi:hypothetical protein
MTVFLRLLEEDNKERALSQMTRSVGACVFEVDPLSFSQIPGSPFWAPVNVIKLFHALSPLENGLRFARQGGVNGMILDGLGLGGNTKTIQIPLVYVGPRTQKAEGNLHFIVI